MYLRNILIVCLSCDRYGVKLKTTNQSIYRVIDTIQCSLLYVTIYLRHDLIGTAKGILFDTS